MADDDFTISDDKTRLDLDVIHGFLTAAYWSKGISRKRVARAIEPDVWGQLCKFH